MIQPPVAGGTYLALGDSLAFGYQTARSTRAPAPAARRPTRSSRRATRTIFGQLFGANTLGVTTVNLGCPGETSGTLINDTNATTGCTTYPFALHSNHPGKTQLQAAVDTVQRFGKRVSPITIDIGANDVLRMVNGQCTTAGVISLTCVQQNAPATFAAVQSNLDYTLNTLRQAGGVKHEIIVIGLYNPLYPAIFNQVLGQTGNFAVATQAADGTDALLAQLNALQADDRGEVPRRVREPGADVQPARRSAPAAGAQHHLHADRGLRPAAGHPPDRQWLRRIRQRREGGLRLLGRTGSDRGRRQRAAPAVRVSRPG